MKRLKRKHLKEDEFVSTIGKFIKYYSTHKKKIFVFLSLAVLAVLLFLGARMIMSKKSQEESRLLSEIFRVRDELKENPEKAAELRKLAGNGKFSRLAYLYLARHRVEEKEWQKAEDILLIFPDNRKDLIYFQARDMLGQVYYFQEKWDKAVQIYERISKEGKKAYAQDLLLFHLAETYEAKGETDKAVELYKKIRDDYPQTYSAYDAERKLGALEEAK